MGCLSREAKERFLQQFWEAQERNCDAFIHDLHRARRAADREQDPYRKRLLVWASNNWDMMETVAYEDSPGLYGTAYAALPEDLRADMQRRRGRRRLPPGRRPSGGDTVSCGEGIDTVYRNLTNPDTGAPGDTVSDDCENQKDPIVYYPAGKTALAVP